MHICYIYVYNAWTLKDKFIPTSNAPFALGHVIIISYHCWSIFLCGLAFFWLSIEPCLQWLHRPSCLSFFIVFKHLILQYVIWGLFSLHIMFCKTLTLYRLSIMKIYYKFLSTFKFLIPACFVIFYIFVLLIWYRKGQGNVDGGSFEKEFQVAGLHYRQNWGLPIQLKCGHCCNLDFACLTRFSFHPKEEL